MTTNIEEKKNLHNEILTLLDTTDIYKYKDLFFINKKWLRKIALAYDLSVTVSDNTLSESIFICSVRVSNSSNRTVEASASQRLSEENIFDIEKAQSRATNRAIYDLYSLQELDLSNIYTWEQNNTQWFSLPQQRKKWEYRSITDKQKSYLKKLISEWSEQWEYHRELIASLDDLSMHEAWKLIHELLQDKGTTTL